VRELLYKPVAVTPGSSAFCSSIQTHFTGETVEINSARRSSKTHRVFHLLCVKECANEIVEFLSSKISQLRKAGWPRIL